MITVFDQTQCVKLAKNSNDSLSIGPPSHIHGGRQEAVNFIEGPTLIGIQQEVLVGLTPSKAGGTASCPSLSAARWEVLVVGTTRPNQSKSFNMSNIAAYQIQGLDSTISACWRVTKVRFNLGQAKPYAKLAKILGRSELSKFRRCCCISSIKPWLERLLPAVSSRGMIQNLNLDSTKLKVQGTWASGRLEEYVVLMCLYAFMHI